MVRGDLQSKDLIEDNWSPTAFISTLKILLVYAVQHKARVDQLYSIGALLQSISKNRIFAKLDS